MLKSQNAFLRLSAEEFLLDTDLSSSIASADYKAL